MNEKMNFDLKTEQLLKKARENDIVWSECQYRDSFVFDEDFKGKRFQRYVEKMKNFIYDKYVSITYEDVTKGLRSQDLKEFIIIFFMTYYLYEPEKGEFESDGMLFECLHNYAYPIRRDIFDKTILTSYLCNPHIDAPFSFGKIIDKEIENVCMDYIRMRCMEMENVDESNYFLTLPENHVHAMFLLDRILDLIKIDIDNFCSSTQAKEMRKIMKQKTVKSLCETNKELVETIDNLKEEMAEKDNKINILNGKLKNEKPVKKDNEELSLLSEQNDALARQNDKLKEKYNQLLSKYETLKEKTNNKITDAEKQEEEIKELDKNGKYLFICYEDVTFKRVILDEFPNASFCDSSININASSTDLVIVLTEHINHSAYYAAKEQCKSKNIPLIHCRFSNLELIKELMWNQMNL